MPKDDDRPPQDTPRFIVVLIVMLALLNVSATVLMLGSWTSHVNGNFGFQTSIPDDETAAAE